MALIKSANDRCHPNGMAPARGDVRYATALGTTDIPRGWVGGKLDGVALKEVPSDRVLTDELCRPHSPRLIEGLLTIVRRT